MQTIYKYILDSWLVGQPQTVNMKKSAKILSSAMQNDKLCIWAIVDTESPDEQRSFIIIGTGHNLASSFKLNYISTVQDSPYVWHLFEIMT